MLKGRLSCEIVPERDDLFVPEVDEQTFGYDQNYFLNELGAVKIYPNVRGSSGYGKNFLKLDDGLRREDAV